MTQLPPFLKVNYNPIAAALSGPTEKPFLLSAFFPNHILLFHFMDVILVEKWTYMDNILS